MSKEAKVESIAVVEETDFDPDMNALREEAEADRGDAFARERLAAWEQGEWEMIGIYLSAEVVVEGTVQTIRTPGLWNIESDSERSYKQEIAEEEYAELKDILAALGIRKAPPLSSARWVRKHGGR